MQDCVNHPLHTAACVIIPEGVLVYQLSKVLVNIADISVAYWFDKEKGKRKLNDYIAPLTQIIHALQNKQLSGPEIVRGTTQLAMHWKAQSKLLGGLSKLYTTSKTKLKQFIKENPFAAPEQYMTTPEGMLLKCTDDAIFLETHPPHCAGQYEALKSSLTIEQFTSIIKTTKHGIQRLIERGFIPEEVKTLLNNPDITRIQNDGAKVFIKVIGLNKYNCLIYNPKSEKVITALKNINDKSLINLGENYGWTL